MTSEEIANGKVLIAHFMGLKQGNDWEFRNQMANWCHSLDLKYNTSWDWLMPVVEKIENLEDGEYMFEICGRRSGISIMVNHNSDDNVTIVEFHARNSNSKMEAIWLSVVEFINRHYEINKIEKPKQIEFPE
jgi:hypothetical protein